MGAARIRVIDLPALVGTAIATTGALTTKAIDNTRYLGDAVGLHLVAAGTAVDLDCTLTVAVKPLDTYVIPYSSDGSSLGLVFDAAGASGTALDHISSFSPALAPYFKVTVTGGAANDATTISRAELIVQENIY